MNPIGSDCRTTLLHFLTRSKERPIDDGKVISRAVLPSVTHERESWVIEHYKKLL